MLVNLHGMILITAGIIIQFPSSEKERYMSISRSIFDSIPNSFNPKVLELFIKNPDKTYSLTELNKKFGDKDSTLAIDLAMLSLDRLERRVINGETYYSLKKNTQI